MKKELKIKIKLDEKEFSQRLRQYIRESGFSQRQFAKYIGYSKNTVNQWVSENEERKKNPDWLPNLVKIMEFFLNTIDGFNPMQLFTDDKKLKKTKAIILSEYKNKIEKLEQEIKTLKSLKEENSQLKKEISQYRRKGDYTYWIDQLKTQDAKRIADFEKVKVETVKRELQNKYQTVDKLILNKDFLDLIDKIKRSTENYITSDEYANFLRKISVSLYKIVLDLYGLTPAPMPTHNNFDTESRYRKK